MCLAHSTVSRTWYMLCLINILTISMLSSNRGGTAAMEDPLLSTYCVLNAMC